MDQHVLIAEIMVKEDRGGQRERRHHRRNRAGEQAHDQQRAQPDLHCDGDDEAQLVIMALAEGKKGKELRDEIGIDQATYDYAMRRIKKALKKKFPEGLPS